MTGQYLSGKKSIPVPTNRRIRFTAENAENAEKRQKHSSETAPSPETRSAFSSSALSVFSAVKSSCLIVKGARQHNLRNIDVAFPLGAFVAVTGVSGSGKSSLVNEVLYQTLARRLHRARTPAAAHDDILGLEHIDKVINVDQDPIGNSPLSNPATYTGVFDLVRELFARLPESKVRGWQPRRFSFTRPGGRCEACEGAGQKKIEMHFLPDVWVECDVCDGKRYNPETLAVRYKNRSIADVLEMRVHEALELFENIPKIRKVLQTLADVGLDYLSLGQAAPTLSGGEAQRVKLAAELARPSTGKTLYVLDEPTTGLHFDDVHKLLDVLNRLVDLGNTVIVVEHNLDVIKTADWVIDLGPEAGPGGGLVVAAGTPEQVAAAPGSHTGAALAPVLAAGPHVERPRYDPFAAAAVKENDVPLEAVGRDAAMPWQTDGRRWHTVERVTSDGKPCRWEGAMLDWLDERIHELGAFADTNWGQRSVVEIAAPNRSQGWFLHALTGQEWLLRLVFRVGQERLPVAGAGGAPGHPAAERDARPGGLRQRRPRLDDGAQGTVAVGDGAGPPPERDRHAGVPRVSGRGRRVVPRRPEADDDEAGRRDAVEGQRRTVAPGRKGISAGEEGDNGTGRCCRACWSWCARSSRACRSNGTTGRRSRCACRRRAGRGRNGGPRTLTDWIAVFWARRGSST